MSRPRPKRKYTQSPATKNMIAMRRAIEVRVLQGHFLEKILKKYFEKMNDLIKL